MVVVVGGGGVRRERRKREGERERRLRFSMVEERRRPRHKRRTIALEIGQLLRGEAQLVLGRGGGRRRGRIQGGQRHLCFAVACSRSM